MMTGNKRSKSQHHLRIVTFKADTVSFKRPLCLQHEIFLFTESGFPWPYKTLIIHANATLSFCLFIFICQLICLLSRFLEIPDTQSGQSSRYCCVNGGWFPGKCIANKFSFVFLAECPANMSFYHQVFFVRCFFHMLARSICVAIVT